MRTINNQGSVRGKVQRSAGSCGPQQQLRLLGNQVHGALRLRNRWQQWHDGMHVCIHTRQIKSTEPYTSIQKVPELYARGLITYYRRWLHIPLHCLDFSHSPLKPVTSIEIPKKKIIFPPKFRCVRDKSFHKQYEQVGKTDLSQLVTTFSVKWKGKKKSGAFFLCVFRVNAACQRGDLLPPQREDNLLTNMKTLMSNKANARLFYTTNDSSFPLENTVIDKWSETQTNPWIWQNVIHAMKLLLPVHLCDELEDVTKTEERVFVGVSGCQVQTRGFLCQVLLNRQKNPPVEKCQQKGNIKATFIRAQRHRAGRKQLKWAYYVHPMLVK